MKKTLTTVVVVLLIIAAALTTWWVIDSNTEPTAEPATSQQESTETEERIESLQYLGEDGKTALELLQEKAEVEMQGSGEMAFVTAIDGVSASDTEFWSFQVNGEMANVGAGSYETSSTDTITWQLQTIDPSFSSDEEITE